MKPSVKDVLNFHLWESFFQILDEAEKMEFERAIFPAPLLMWLPAAVTVRSAVPVLVTISQVVVDTSGKGC